MSEVVDNAAQGRFELAIDGAFAFVEYRIDGDAIYFTHTETPLRLRGRGIAGQVVHAALASAKQRGLKIVPRCSYVVDYIAEHPEFRS